MRKILNIVQHILEIIIVFIMTVGGVQTIMFSGTKIATTTALGAALASPWLLSAFGVVFVIGGTMLIVSKLSRNHKLHQLALMIIFTSNLFGVLIEILILGVPAFGWVDNLVYALIAGVIHFKRDREEPIKITSNKWFISLFKRSTI